MLPETLGHYRIVRLLGKGGMGEVYLAEDLTLGRQVALKVLPPELAAAGRRDRFDREARAVAALNHPNIVTLHSIDQSGDTPFLTMEFVDGKPLGKLIPPTGLPLDRLLKIAIPLADAVGAAHQRGILHRDLKPANVMITADGRVKVLDFGLAKLQEDREAREALPTQELTGEGRIVGTVAYMSPEQAQGNPVDQRSDVFSIGVLLYELATGKRPFTGDTSLSVLSAILKDTPRAVSELKPDLPRDFARIVRRALNKDPEERYQSAKDLRNDLNSVLADLASGELVRSAAAPAAVPDPARRSHALIAVVTIAGAIGTLAVASWLFTSRQSTPLTSSAPDAWTPTRLTSSGLLAFQAAVSPDGRYVAYVQRAGSSGPGMWLRQIATNTDVVVRPPERAQFDGIAFSPDSSFIYFSTMVFGDNAATLYRVPVIGGAPQKILFNVDTPVTFSPDGRRIAFIVDFPSERRSVLEVANADGMGRTKLAERISPDRFVINPGRLAWSPDGSTIAAPVTDGAGQSVALINAATGESRMISAIRWPAVNSVQWLPGGRELVVAYRDSGAAGQQLWRVDIQSGASTPVSRDLFSYTDVSIAADGEAIVAIASLGESTLWTADAGRQGEATQITTSAADGDGSAGVDWMADGHVVYSSRASGNPDLWTLDTGTGTRRQLTTDPADDRQPAVSPDGRSIAFVSTRQGGSRIWVMHVDGSEPRAVSRGPADMLPFWTPDGQAILFISSAGPAQVSVDRSGQQSLMDAWPPRAGEPAKMFRPRAISRQGLVAGFEEVDPKRGGGWRLAFAPLDRSAPPTLLEVTAGTSIGPVAWTSDGKGIGLPLPNDAWNVWRYPIDGAKSSRVTAFTGLGITRSFAWSPGGRLLVSRGENKADLVLFKRVSSR